MNMPHCPGDRNVDRFAVVEDEQKTADPNRKVHHDGDQGKPEVKFNTTMEAPHLFCARKKKKQYEW